MREIIKLKSGAELQFGEPSFDEASELMAVLASEFIKVNVDLGNLTDYMGSDGDVSELLKDSSIANTFKNAVCQLIASKPFRAQLLVCMKRSLLNGEKVTLESFEKARGDFLPVCWEVIKLTLAPFVGSLNLSSPKSTKATPSIQA